MDDPSVIPPMRFLTGAGSLALLLLGLLLVYVARLIGRGARLGQRWGIRHSERARLWADWVRLGGWLLALTSAARWGLSRVSPLAGLWISVGAFALLAITGTFRDAAGVLLTRVRYRIARADHVRIGQHAGVVERVAWDHLQLRDRSAERLVVPGRALLGGAVHVQPRRGGVALDCNVSASLTSDGLARFRDAVTISAYRVPNTPLSVQASEGVVRVRFQVWAQSTLEAAEQQVLDKLRELERGGSASVPPPPKP